MVESDGGLKAGPVRIPHAEIDVSFARSGGPFSFCGTIIVMS